MSKEACGSYSKQIENANSIADLEELAEKMAYDATITHAEYQHLVSGMLSRIDAGMLKPKYKKEEHWDGSWSDESLPYLGW